MNAHQKGKGWCSACSSLLPLRTNRKPDKRQQNTCLTYRQLLRQQGLKGTQVGVKGDLQNSEEKEVTDPFWEQSQGSGSGLKAQAGGRYQQREKQAELVGLQRPESETSLFSFLVRRENRKRTLILSVFPSRYWLNSEATGWELTEGLGIKAENLRKAEGFFVVGGGGSPF